MFPVSAGGRAAVYAALLLLSGAGASTSFSVSPVIVTLEPGGRSAVLEFTNTGDRDAAVQVDAVAWTQDDAGDDSYAQTEELIAVPPIFRLAAGESQLVRVGLLGDSVEPAERSFRLFFEELSEVSPGNETAVRMRMRIGVPVFIATRGQKADLDLAGIERDGARLRMRFVNSGNAHVKLLKLALVDAAGREIASMPGAYILAGAQREFVFNEATAGSSRVRLYTSTLGAPEYELPPLP